jgi:hypothetical protein
MANQVPKLASVGLFLGSERNPGIQLNNANPSRPSMVVKDTVSNTYGMVAKRAAAKAIKLDYRNICFTRCKKMQAKPIPPTCNCFGTCINASRHA